MSSPLEVWSYRDLIKNLAQRDLRARYKRSIIGWAWSLLNPAATLATYSLVFGVIMRAQPPGLGNGEPGIFAMYLFCGLIIWNLFSGVITQTIGSFQAAGGLLTRTYFPPETPVVASMLNVVLQAFLEVTVMMVVFIVVANVSWTVILLVPIILLATAFGLGIGMVLAVMNIRYRDVSYLVGIALQVWFFATPIVYPLSMIDERHSRLIRLMELNPMHTFVHSARQVAYSLTTPTLVNWVVMTVLAVVSLGFGWRTFSRMAPKVIEEL